MTDSDTNASNQNESVAVIRVREMHAELLRMIKKLRSDPRTPKTFKGNLKQD